MPGAIAPGLILEHLLAASPDTAIGVADAGLRVRYLSPGALELLQCEPGDVLGRPVDRLYGRDPSSAERLQEAVRRVRDGATFHYRVERPAADGRPRTLGMSVSAMWDGGGLAGYLVHARDMTEHGLLEHRLRASRLHCRALLEHMRDALFLHDAATLRIEEVNRAAEQLLGYGRDELCAMTPLDLSAEPAKTRLSLEGLRSGAIPMLRVTRRDLRHRNGQRVPVELVATRLELDGRAKVLTTLRGIADRVRMEQRLRDREHWLSTLLAALPHGVQEMDTAGTIEYCNPACERMLGYGPGELVGRSLWDHLPADEVAPLERYLARAVAAQPPPAPYFNRARCRDGRIIEVQVDWDYRRGPAGEVTGFIAVITEVTERRRIERALQESEERFALFMDHLPGAVFIKDEEGRILYVNRFLEDTFAAAGWVGEATEALFPAEVARAMREDDRRALAAGQVERRELVPMPDGSERVFHTQKFAIRRDGRAPLVGGVAMDITERRRQEEERRQAQKMEALGELTGGIAHDFNNILATVLGFADLALLRLEHLDRAILEAYLQEIRVAAVRGRDLVEQMLRYSRGGGGEEQVLELQPLVKEAVRMLRATLPSSIRIVTVVDPPVPPVRAVPVHVHQALINLCINARDAMDGRGELQVALRLSEGLDGHCSACGAAVTGARVELSVSDDGPGVPAALKRRIFEPFFTTKDPDRGTGMGLAVVHGVLCRNRGHVVLESGEGRGACFRLLFPAEPAAGPPPPPAGEELAVVGGAPFGGRVLVVDDEPQVVRVLCGLLEALGFEPEGHEDGTAALARFSAVPDAFRLVVSDQTMPGLTGTELAARIHDQRPELPVLLVSGYSEALDGAATAGLGLHRVLRKPVDAATLAAALRELLAESPAPGP